MWGAKSTDAPELERNAGEVQAVFLAMPPEHRLEVAATIRAMVAAGAGLRLVPDELGGALGRLLMRVIYEIKSPFGRKLTPAQMARQIAAGAGGILAELGVTPAEIETLVGGG